MKHALQEKGPAAFGMPSSAAMDHSWEKNAKSLASMVGDCADLYRAGKHPQAAKLARDIRKKAQLVATDAGFYFGEGKASFIKRTMRG